jgi:hypothetical protein
LPYKQIIKESIRTETGNSQILNLTDFLQWEFIYSLIYTGFWFIQGSVETGFTVLLYIHLHS